MARFDAINDLYWTEAGDFFLGTNGDLEDTSQHHYRGFTQRVDARLRSRRGDWPEDSVGANLNVFVGKPNTEATGDEIRNKIYNELIQEDLLRGSEFLLEVLPISKTAVAVAVIINPPRSQGQKVLVYTYDLRDNRLVPRNI